MAVNDELNLVVGADSQKTWTNPQILRDRSKPSEHACFHDANRTYRMMFLPPSTAQLRDANRTYRMMFLTLSPAQVAEDVFEDVEVMPQ